MLKASRGQEGRSTMRRDSRPAILHRADVDVVRLVDPSSTVIPRKSWRKAPNSCPALCPMNRSKRATKVNKPFISISNR